MLGLERKVDESVIIDLNELIQIAIDAAGPTGHVVKKSLENFTGGDNLIEVKVLRIGIVRVGLGVKAARNIRVCRDELEMNPKKRTS